MPLDDRKHFTVHRFNEVTGKVEPLTFSLGDTIKVAIGQKPYQEAVICGISQAKRKFKVKGRSFGIDMGYAYLATYDEFAKPRAEVDAKLNELERRLERGVATEAQWFIDSARAIIHQHNLGDYGQSRMSALQQKAFHVSRATTAQIVNERARQALLSTQRKDVERARSEPEEPLQMTMAEWKSTHKDFKGIYGGQRMVLRNGGLQHVVIIKTPQTSAARKSSETAHKTQSPQ
ncbi:hypothetical protein V8Z74_14525 [Comamonas sp. w2-DMI]|uniref:hypothetical protein n=1 Tax=Comamonas sp. w2-DMI TaxID=3126391 RepID=UPI0032E42EE0